MQLVLWTKFLGKEYSYAVELEDYKSEFAPKIVAYAYKRFLDNLAIIEKTGGSGILGTIIEIKDRSITPDEVENFFSQNEYQIVSKEKVLRGTAKLLMVDAINKTLHFDTLPVGTSPGDSIEIMRHQ